MDKPKFDIGQEVWIVYFCGGPVEKPMEHYAVFGPTKITMIRIDQGGTLYETISSPDGLMGHGSLIYSSQAEAEAAKEKNAIDEMEHQKKVWAEREADKHE